MKLKSVSSLAFYVSDLAQTVPFYEALGFEFKERDERHAKAYLNWFSMDFVAAPTEGKAEFLAEANAQPRGSGVYINISVDDVDDFYQGVVAKGLKPSSEPRDWPWGNREFVLRDPDGYKLVFFKKR